MRDASAPTAVRSKYSTNRNSANVRTVYAHCTALTLITAVSVSAVICLGHGEIRKTSALHSRCPCRNKRYSPGRWHVPLLLDQGLRTENKQTYRERDSSVDQPRNSKANPATVSQRRILAFETALLLIVSYSVPPALERGIYAHPTTLGRVPWRCITDGKDDFGAGSARPITTFQDTKQKFCRCP